MKKLLILNGSPRKKGNTAILSEYLKNYVDGKLSVEHLFLYDYIINPCTDCRACKEDDFTCVIDDGMQDLYRKLDNSDFIVFGTPIYWYGPTAVMKMMIDRFRPYFASKKLKGKKAALILPAGSGESDCNLTLEMFRRVFDTLGVEFIGAITSQAYDAGDSFNDKKALNEIENLSEKLVSI